jgi:ZIP family zinc transporter
MGEEECVSDLLDAAPWALAVGGSLLGGALIAAVKEVPTGITAAVTAFGGGALLAAVAFDVVPRADREAGAAWTAGGIIAGMLIFVAADWLLERVQPAHRSKEEDEVRGESIAAGLFIDGVPESAALGLTIAGGDVGLALLAGIVVSNGSEGYGSAQLIHDGGRSRAFATSILAGIALALAAATIGGSLLPEDVPETITGTGAAVAAGAIIATVAIAIIPQAFERVSRLTAVVAALGFVAGYVLT